MPLSVAAFSSVLTFRLARGVWISTLAFFLSLSSTLILHAASNNAATLATTSANEIFLILVLRWKLARGHPGLRHDWRCSEWSPAGGPASGFRQSWRRPGWPLASFQRR